MTDRPIECRVVLTATDFIMRNHHVHGVSVMPGVTFLDILLRILRSQGLDHEQAVLTRILFTEAVATTEGRDREIRITIGAADASGQRPVRADSRWAGVPGSPWRENLTALLGFDAAPVDTDPARPAVAAQPPAIDLGALRSGAVRRYDMAELYARARDENIRHGPAMACHGLLHVGDGYLLAELTTGAEAPDPAAFHLHPALLDAATIAAYGQTEAVSREPFIPVYIDRVRAPRPLGRTVHLYVPGVERLAGSGDVIRSDYGLYDEQGLLLAEFGALTCKRIRRPELITRLLDEPTARATMAAPQTAEPATQAAAPSPATTAGPVESVAAGPEAVAAYTARLRQLAGEALGREPAEVGSGTGFYELGLDSADLVRISALLEETVGSPLYPTLLFEFTDIDSLAAHLAETHPAGATAAAAPQPSAAAGPFAAAVTAAPAAEPGPSATALFRPRWYPAPAPAAAGYRPEGDVLLFAPDGGPDGLAAELAARCDGATVVTVGPGPVFEQAGVTGYRLDPADPGQLDQLWSALEARGIRPAALVVPAAAEPAPASDGPHGPALTVLRLARSVLGRRPARAAQLLFVHPAPAGGGAPEHLAVGALARCVTAEAPALACRCVGVQHWTAGAVAEAVLAELAAGGTAPQSRHLDGRRELRGLAPAASPAALPAALPAAGPDAALPLKRHGVYVVTGGGGALATVLADHLARRHAARIALVGRRPMSAEQAARAEEWRAAGAEVVFLTADVTRRADVEAALALVRERFGPPDGVFHTAGVTADSLVRNKPDGAPPAVVAPKALGAVHLDRATAGDRLDLFVLYSSLSASQANPGQSDYAFANAYLEHFAEARAARADRPGRTYAIGWPMWADGAMKLTPDALDHARRTRGTWPMPTADALDLLERVLAAPGARRWRCTAHRTGWPRRSPAPMPPPPPVPLRPPMPVRSAHRSGRTTGPRPRPQSPRSRPSPRTPPRPTTPSRSSGWPAATHRPRTSTCSGRTSPRAGTASPPSPRNAGTTAPTSPPNAAGPAPPTAAGAGSSTVWTSSTASSSASPGATPSGWTPRNASS